MLLLKHFVAIYSSHVLLFIVLHILTLLYGQVLLINLVFTEICNCRHDGLHILNLHL